MIPSSHLRFFEKFRGNTESNLTTFSLIDHYVTKTRFGFASSFYTGFGIVLVLILQIFTYTQFGSTPAYHSSRQSGIIPDVYADIISQDQINAVKQNMTSLGFTVSPMSDTVCDVADVGSKNFGCVAL